MSDPHFNIFNAYRGSASLESIRERQLEDNLTRALIITLNSLMHLQARNTLLATLGFTRITDDEPIQCKLQVSRVEEHWPTNLHKSLVVAHGGGKLNVADNPDTAVTSRSDAVIMSRRQMVVIESKLGDTVTKSQLLRHREAFNVDRCEIHNITWAELARTARRIRFEQRLDPVSKFVVEQFEEYLRMNGFAGLTEEHLSFFAQPPDHRDELVKEGIRRSLESIMHELSGAWPPSWRARVGNIRRIDSSAWAKLEPDLAQQSPHLSIAIGSAGLDIFANIETERPYRRFLAKWHSDPDGLIAIIRQLGNTWPPADHSQPPYRFVVVSRIPTDRPRVFGQWTKIDIAMAELKSWPDEQLRWFIENAVRKPEHEAAPEIAIMRTYQSSWFLHSGAISDRLVQDAEELKQFFNWLDMHVGA